MNKRNFKSLVAVLLTVLMVFSIVPMSVSAAETTYTLIDSVDELTAGTYKMGGYRESYNNNDWSANPYHIWTGSISGNGSNNRDLITTCYSYADGKLLVAEGSTDNAGSIELVAVEGKANTYYIVFGGKYLYSTTYANRRLAFGDTATEWVATNNSNGGITMTTTLADGTISLGLNDANSNLLRSYKDEINLKSGLIFFAASSEGGTDGGEDKEEETPSTPVVPLTNGMQIVIYNPEYNKALSSELVSETSYYQKGVDITVTDGKVTGYGDTEVWTVVANDDGTFSFQQGDQKIGMNDTNASMSMGAVNDKWEITSLGDDLYNVKNVARGKYMEWYNKYSNWSTYSNGNEATDPLFQLSFYDVNATDEGDKEEDKENETPALPTTPEEIVNAAYALEPGATLEGTYTLTGVITSVDEAYSEQFSNVTVTIQVGDMTDKLIKCYRLKGEGADTIKSGDTITVTGVLTNYNGTIEFNSGCTLDNVVPGKEEVVIYETPEEILNAAYALEAGKSLSDSYKYTLTGVITSVDTAYDSGYKNVTVTIVVDGMTDKPIQCFRLKGEGADVIKVGDTITVTGSIVNYQNKDGSCTVEFNSGCTLDSYKAATPKPDGGLGDAMTVTVLLAVIALASVAMVVVSRKRRFN